ncbi:peflin or Penta-EF hand domain-containing protein 1 [Chamberlinius hualienensis]
MSLGNPSRDVMTLVMVTPMTSLKKAANHHHLQYFLQSELILYVNVIVDYKEMYSQPNEQQETLFWFKSVDIDRSGRITASELQQALTNADWSTFSLSTCKLLINLFDPGRSGSIGFAEFDGIIRYTRDWQSTFGRFDSDKSGFIDPNELFQALSLMGYRLSPEFAGLLVSLWDPVEKKKMSLDNFIYVCVKLHMLTEKFKTLDKQMTGNIALNFDTMIYIFAETM